MFNLIIAIATAVITFTAILLALPSYGMIAAWLPMLVVGVAVYILLARRIGKKVEQIVERATHDLQQGRIEQAIRILETASVYNRWQFLVEAQINAQIGGILFMQRKFKEAEPYLEKAFSRQWNALGMLAAIHFRRHRLDEAVEVMEKAVKYSKKEALAWGLYGYILDKGGRREAALEVLQRGAQKCGDSEPIKNNITRLQNRERMKMKPFGDDWYQFQFESPSAKRFGQAQPGKQRRSRRALRG
jgi:tetratricopeptide (TPR) repeat protein